MPTHRVHFQPVDIDIDVNEDETVLNAAFRQGVSLTHGCREGQCSACKSFLLDGDIEMEKYSTFALPTHDIKRLVLKLAEPGKKMRFNAGQYTSLRIPGSEEYRAYSMANTPRSSDRLEFIIKVFPGGLFSGLLEGGITVGQEMEAKGPYGVFRLREKSDSDIICVGGGSGMAPIWSLLNDMAERSIKRKATYFYGARTQKDLFYLDPLQQLEERLPGFRFVPALSMATAEDEWTGETGLITEVLERNLEPGQIKTQAYLCGPPPMIDAAIPVLIRKGISEDRIFFDKFTSTGKVE